MGRPRHLGKNHASGGAWSAIPKRIMARWNRKRVRDEVERDMIYEGREAIERGEYISGEDIRKEFDLYGHE